MAVETIAAYAVGVVILIVIFKLFSAPLKLIVKLIANSIIGGLGLLAFNLVGGFVGINIGVNLLTCVIVGLLGIPGLALILLLQCFFAG